MSKLYIQRSYVLYKKSVRLCPDEKHKKVNLIMDQFFEAFISLKLLFELFKIQKIIFFKGL